MSAVRLSATMIVRNEERFLEGCLRSLQGHVDEVVIVDTGSTDRSRDIARDFNARVVDRPWNGDFAAVRNASIDAARGEWLLYIDADERVVAFDRAAMEPLLSDPQHICYTVLFRPAIGYSRYRESRLFRKRPDLRFQGVIHETLVPALEKLQLRAGLKVGESPVALDHYGYEGDLRHKHLRNLPLLQARLKREPNHVYCLDQLGLAQRGLGDDAAAEASWRQAIDAARIKSPPEGIDSLPYLHLANLLLDSQRDAMAVLDEGCRRYPDNHSLTWLRARHFIEQARHADAMPLFERLAAIDPERIDHSKLAFDTSIFGAQAHAALGLCAFRLGHFAASAEHYARAQRLAPDNLEIRTKQAVAAVRARAQSPA